MGDTNNATITLNNEEVVKKPFATIPYDSAFKLTWDWIIIFLIFYVSIIIPYNLVFYNTTGNILFFAIALTVDLIFFIDIILNFQTTFIGPGGKEISDLKTIRLKYLKSWFTIDLLSCLPFYVGDVFYLDEDIITILNYLTILKLGRILELGRIARKLDTCLNYGMPILLTFLCLYILNAHWLACVWYFFAKSDVKNGVQYNWLWKLASTSENPYTYIWPNSSSVPTLIYGPSPITLYLTSLYFTISCLTTVGLGNIVAETRNEKLFGIWIMITAALLCAMIFGLITNVILQMSDTSAKYHKMLNNVKQFLALYDFPKSLSERITCHITSKGATMRGINQDKVLHHCPKILKPDIGLHLHRKIFDEHPVFKLASDGCLRALATRFCTLELLPDDILYHIGDYVDCLSFVISGSLEVIQDEERVAVMGRGDVIGDIFWKENTVGQSVVKVRAVTRCDLRIIKKDKLSEVLDVYQDFANDFANNFALTYNVRHPLIRCTVAEVYPSQNLTGESTSHQNQNMQHTRQVPQQQISFKNNLEMEVHPYRQLIKSLDYIDQDSQQQPHSELTAEQSKYRQLVLSLGYIEANILLLNDKMNKTEQLLSELLRTINQRRSSSNQ